MIFALADAVAATGARTIGEGFPEAIAVSTDTRQIARGSAFLALRGERFDGHKFVEEAFARGAGCAIVDDAAEVPEGKPALVVADTLRAYLALGGLARSRVRGTVVGITGSTGKTTTKQFLLDLLRGAGVNAVATPENENNEVGVAKFLCALDDGDERVAIVEMGARKFRDLDPLVEAAKPDVGVLTNIGEAHLEIMGTPERIAETKWALPSGAREAVLNLADTASAGRAATLAHRPLWFGIDEERPPHGERAVVLGAEAAWTVGADGVTETHRIDIGFPGDHNRRNLAAAFATALLCGGSADRLAAAVAALHLPHGRYEISEAGDVRVIFDAYNASLSGTIATLATFGRENATRRIAVLGGMKELGADAPAMHEKIGELGARFAAVVLAGGDFAADTARGAQRAGCPAVIAYKNNAEAIAWLTDNVGRGDVVLLKGSRAYKMEEIAEALGAEVFA